MTQSGRVSSSVLADSLVLRNLLLRQAPNRWVQLGRLRGGDSMVVDHFISLSVTIIFRVAKQFIPHRFDHREL